MAITTKNLQGFDVQVLEDMVQGEFAQKNAFMGSLLVSSGAVEVNGAMPGAPGLKVGTKVTVPYFGTMGDFAANADGSAATPQTIASIIEEATVARASLAFEVSAWAQNNGPMGGDPYQEQVRQIKLAATRYMDKSIIDSCAGSPLVHDVYNSGTPAYFTWDGFSDALSKFGDEEDGVVAMVTHSKTKNDLRKMKDTTGRPLLVEAMAQGEFTRFMGVPLIVSDRAPLTGSTMGTVTSAGTTPPVATLTGTPLGAWNLRLKCTVGGAHGTAQVQFSTDGGVTWSANIATVSAATVIPLIDTAVDSLVGVNGKSGVSVAFAAGTFNVDNTWSSNANLKVTTMALQRGAAAFWFANELLSLQTDRDILADTTVGAMHLYHAAHRYRRRRGGSKPGVLRYCHNVGGYVG